MASLTSLGILDMGSDLNIDHQTFHSDLGPVWALLLKFDLHQWIYNWLLVLATHLELEDWKGLVYQTVPKIL